MADNIAVYVDKVYLNLSETTGLSLIVATLFFSVQVYCDFSAYSDIARGCAKLFGIEIMENFKSPYYSTSIKEFWSRWHISLSTWFRDYVYIPLGGNRVSKPRHCFNLFITFLLSGLWHGANWTFLIWGAIHGVAQIIENALHIKALRKKGGFVFFVRAFIVFLIVTAAWVFFRAADISDAVYVFSHSFDGITNPVSYLLQCWRDMDFNVIKLVFIAFFYLLPLSVYDYISTKKDVIISISAKPVVLRYTVYVVFITAVVLLAHIAADTEFIYFQF